MGKFKPDMTAASPAESRWFTWMTGFSTAAVILYLGRIAFSYWSIQELRERKEAASSNELLIGSAREFMQQIELTSQVMMALLLVCCAGFIITGGMWVRTMRQRKSAARTKARR